LRNGSEKIVSARLVVDMEPSGKVSDLEFRFRFSSFDFEFRVSISSFDFEFQFRVSISSFDFALLISSFNLDLKFRF